MGLEELQKIMNDYYTKMSSLQATVKEKSQEVNNAQSAYDIAIEKGNIDNIGSLLSAITTAKNDLAAVEEALAQYSSVKPLERSQIVSAWESVYNDTVAPIEEAKTALDTIKESYIQAIKNYISSGEKAEAARREFVSLFIHTEKIDPSKIGTKGYLHGEPEALIKKVPSFRVDVSSNYANVKIR